MSLINQSTVLTPSNAAEIARQIVADSQKRAATREAASKRAAARQKLKAKVKKGEAQ